MRGWVGGCARGTQSARCHFSVLVFCNILPRLNRSLSLWPRCIVIASFLLLLCFLCFYFRAVAALTSWWYPYVSHGPTSVLFHLDRRVKTYSLFSRYHPSLSWLRRFLRFVSSSPTESSSVSRPEQTNKSSFRPSLGCTYLL